MHQTISLYQTPGIPCPYLPDRVWRTLLFHCETFDETAYERLLSAGFRRSGKEFYQNICPGCSACVPLRVPVRSFEPSRSQRRAARRNADIAIEIHPAAYTRELFDLYNDYCGSRHGKDELELDSFKAFLCESPIETVTMEYRRQSDSRLIGAGWVDVLPNGLSSVYFAFDPREERRSLGVFSVEREIRLAERLGKEWLYLGFWVRGSRKMDYKARFCPHEILEAGGWRGTQDHRAI